MVAPPANNLVLEGRNLTGVRGPRTLFENVSLQLAPGEALELRGPNGSGKSTLLRILAGLTRAETGEVAYAPAAGNPDREALRHYLGHADAIKPNESAGQQARFWAKFFGRPEEAAITALKRLGLANRRDVPGRGLSAGQRRRLALARLLIDPRPIWLLDEPVAGLDVEGQATVEALVADHLASGGVLVAAVHGTGFKGARSLDLTAAPTPTKQGVPA